MTDAAKNGSAPAAETGSTTPPPTPAAPSPLVIGRAFLKQYYQVLSSNPTQITRFYKNNSLISHSLVPSEPATTQTLSDVIAAHESNTGSTFVWCKPKKDEEGNEIGKLCLDFSRGAIDAQETINGGILLVVTGHIRLPKDDAEKTDDGDDDMKRFVHTFFLNNGAPAGKKRQFYVANDILRFLDEGVHDHVDDEDAAVEDADAEVKKEESTEADETEATAETADGEDKTEEEASAEVESEEKVEEKTDEVEEEEAKVSEEKSEQKDGDATTTEEEKETTPVEEPKKEKETTATEETSKQKTADEKKDKKSDGASEKKSRKNKSRGRARKSRSSSPNDSNNKNASGKGKKAGVPGSWASLVAGGPSAAESKEEKKSAPQDKSSKKQSTEKQKSQEQSSSDQQDAPPQKQALSKKAQRTAEATILIKNIPDRTKEDAIKAMFEPYATKLQKKILGTTLLANRGFCFVDFDSKDVVDEIIKEVEAEKASKKDGDAPASKFSIQGKPLEVGRKVPADKSSGNAGGRGGFKNRGGRSGKK